MKRAAVYGCAVGLILAIAVEAGRVVIGGNFHAVVPGRVYRCAQPTPHMLERLEKVHGVRTVVNLRGTCEGMPCYEAECRATQRLDMAQEDIGMCAGRLPGVNEIREIIDVFEHCEYPIVIHCKQGADRTGLASVMYLLLHTDASLAKARRQMSVCYGHVPMGRTKHLDRFFDLYADWLTSKGLEHSREEFRHWATEIYCPDGCRCRLEALDLPSTLPCGQPAAIHVRVQNTSPQTWSLRQDYCAGIHLYYSLKDDNNSAVNVGRSGLFDAEVAPGESIDITVPLPAVRKPGVYRLILDMVDEQQCSFAQVGSEPLEQELTFRE